MSQSEWTKALGLLAAISTQISVGVLMGTGLGYLGYKYFPGPKWLILIGGLLGFATGLSMVIRLITKENK